MSDRHGWNALALAGAALLFARGAGAQSSVSPPIAPAHHDHGQRHRAPDASAPSPAAPSGEPAPPPLTAAEYGEQRARAGDCAGALDAFDRGLRTDYSPELRRDRGACHEKLGHPFPAIDDYRAYLTARPGASDADAIRTRLEALESSVGILKGNGKNGKGGGADLDVSVGTAGESDALSASGSSSSGKNLDKVEHDEQLDLQADSSPVRRGTGFMLALGFDPEGYGKSALGFALVAGIDLRYSVSRVSSLLLELNFEHVNSTGADNALGGPGVRAGYEARLALDPHVNDALLVGATLAYEHLSQGSTAVVFSDVEPRGRFGYRHVFGPSLGLEGTLDGGLAFLHLTGASSSADTTTVVIGGHVALVLGF